ncbi:ABC transporter ATP-binding protein [Aeromicrobium duanguangcaii]|uniref:ABC transporter ATP-binding protein n=1 Tax=Aeromicrobium duanguangcaii TaxID=2968086 RepID=A0ABY5KG01_9ACTN|nr:ABC transporter ATP-binding protein [Aeromicrobium duanguangcaii]MCD9154153.1 ABC transporter ATP-binding protein [Aeromicrobium duanguangcaii]UUI68775.1 ABC transporter ATP-binding protein [Aeromicrobium duanguangcaii]
MTAAAIEVRQLVVERGGRTVLDGLDLTIPRGRITGLLGPSGCGKSTLIRSLVGVQIVKSGTVDVLGEPGGSAVNRRRVGYVTQGSSVYDDLTVAQNLAYFAAIYGVEQERVDEVLRSVDLADRRDQLTRSLSGGQRARVSLAAALLASPDVYLLDEPTVGLDPVLRRDLWRLFTDLASAGATLLVSSHVMDEADRCDEVLLMREGRLIAQDTPAGLRAATGTQDIESAFLALATGGGR